MSEDGLAEHLDEAAVGVPGEALVAGLAWPGPARNWSLRPMLRTVSIIPGIENFAPERTDTSSGSSGLRRGACPSALQRGQVRADLLGRAIGTVPRRYARQASRGDRESGRDRKPQVGHFGEVGALAPEEVLQVFVSFGEVVDELRHDSPPPGAQ